MDILNTSCPVCSSRQVEVAEFCHRCGAHLLLLEKILQEAKQLQKNQKFTQSNALYLTRKNIL